MMSKVGSTMAIHKALCRRPLANARICPWTICGSGNGHGMVGRIGASWRCRSSSIGVGMRGIGRPGSSLTRDETHSRLSARDLSTTDETDLAGASTKEEMVQVVHRVHDLICKGYKELGDDTVYNDAIRLCDEKLPHGSAAQNSLRGFVLNAYGNYAMSNSNPRMGRACFKDAFEHAISEAYRGLGDDRYSDICSFANDLACAHHSRYELEEANKLLKKALYWVKNAKVNVDVPLMCATMSNLALVEASFGNRDKMSTALDRAELAWKEAANIEDAIVRTSCLVNFVIILRLFATFQEAEVVVPGEVEKIYELSEEALRNARVAYVTLLHDDSVPDTERQRAGNLLFAALINKANGILQFSSDSFYLAQYNNSEMEAYEAARELAQEANDLDVKETIPALFTLGATVDSVSEAVAIYNDLEMKIFEEYNNTAEDDDDDHDSDLDGEADDVHQSPIEDEAGRLCMRATVMEMEQRTGLPMSSKALRRIQETLGHDHVGIEEFDPTKIGDIFRFYESEESEEDLHGLKEDLEDRRKFLLQPIGPNSDVSVLNHGAFIRGLALKEFCNKKK